MRALFLAVLTAAGVMGLPVVSSGAEESSRSKPRSKSNVTAGAAAQKDKPAGPAVAPQAPETPLRIKFLKEEAAKGDVEAWYQLGGLYLNGLGVKQDKVEGASWWIKAAEAGHVEAQRGLGACYQHGDGVKVDYEKALYWTRKAIEKGDPMAMYNMGMHYLHGMGVPKDREAMMSWFERSGNAGLVDAQRYLGLIYSTGEHGVGQDQEEACRWFAMGVKQDDADCLIGLGRAYFSGEGVKLNLDEAIRLWRRAAEQGHPTAMGMLAVFYSEGVGVSEDPVQAYVWTKLAANKGEEESIKKAARLGANLSKSEMARAREKIAEFTPRGPKPLVAANNNTTTTPPRTAPAIPAFPGLAPKPGKTPPYAKPKPKEDEGILIGTGFFITKSGYLVTNYHVIGLGRTIHIMAGKDKEVQAKLVAHDKKADLAILKVSSGEHPCLPIATSLAVKLGASVATVGFPNPEIQGFAPKLSKGEIASLAGLMDDPNCFQISVPLQPGNSGGSLVDAQGNVVGVVCGILDQGVALATTGTLASNVAYAIKSSLLLELMTSVPGLVAELAAPQTQKRAFEDVVAEVEHATVLIIAE